MRLLVLFFVSWSLLACGVRGRPLPPDEPARLGRGEPRFKGQLEQLQLRPLEEVVEELDSGSSRRKSSGESE